MPNEPQKVTVQTSRIDASILPPAFSLPYRLYVIQQTTEMKNIADASNNANDLAYQATVKNREQDTKIADHEIRIIALKSEVVDREKRISANTQNITLLSNRVKNTEGSVANLQKRTENAESAITGIQKDYLSRSATSSQTLASPLNVTSSYSVNGVQVVGVRVTGFTPATGTANKGAFNADQSFTVGKTYSQSEIQAIASALRDERQRMKALEDALRAHGLIN